MLEQINQPEQNPDECALYRHFSATGELLYVGISLSPVRRLGEHQEKPWAKQITSITVEWLPSRAVAMVREAAAIREERPKFNVVWNRQAPPKSAALTALTAFPANGAEFRAAREALGLTQGQLAKVMGYGAKTRISAIEGRGVVPPQAARLMVAYYVAGYRPEDWPALIAES